MHFYNNTNEHCNEALRVLVGFYNVKVCLICSVNLTSINKVLNYGNNKYYKADINKVLKGKGIVDVVFTRSDIRI